MLPHVTKIPARNPSPPAEWEEGDGSQQLPGAPAASIPLAALLALRPLNHLRLASPQQRFPHLSGPLDKGCPSYLLIRGVALGKRFLLFEPQVGGSSGSGDDNEHSSNTSISTKTPEAFTFSHGGLPSGRLPTPLPSRCVYPHTPPPPPSRCPHGSFGLSRWGFTCHNTVLTVLSVNRYPLNRPWDSHLPVI